MAMKLLEFGPRWLMSFRAPTSPNLRFGPFELDSASGELRKSGILMRLQPQPFQVLVLLAMRAGNLVTRQEIQRNLWSDSTFVDFEHGINFAINQIRGALADNAEAPRYIETLPRRGYRFIAKVEHEASTTEVHIVQAPRTVDDPGAPVGTHSSSAPEPFVAALPSVTGRTGWKRRTFVLAAAAAGMALLAFTGFAVRREVFRKPTINFGNLQISKLTDHGRVEQLAISPDGRFVAYVASDAEESGLRIRHVDTRSDVEILLPDTNREKFLALTFSPDSNYIYYVQSNKDGGGYNSLYKAPLLGGPPHLLGRYADTPLSFSPNGKEFAFTEGFEDRNILEVRIASADGSGDRLVASIPDGDADSQLGPAWSPNGQTLALPVKLRGEKLRWVLDAVSVADGSVQELYSFSREIGHAVWLPDGETLLMTIRDEGGRGQLWAISYPRGKQVRLTNDLEDYDHNIDITRDGKTVAAIATKHTSNVWVLPDGDASRGRQIASSPVALVRVASMPLGKVLMQSADGEMWRMKADGSDRTPFTILHNVSFPTPCGQFVVFNSFHDDSVDLMRVDAAGLNPIRLFGDIYPPACSADGNYVFVVSVVKPNTILRLPLEGGNPVEIARSLGPDILPGLSISPSGKLLAYAYDVALPATGTRLAVTPVSGGAALQTFQVASDVSRLHWSPDGQSLQYVLTRNGITNIWAQRLGGGEPKQITHFTSGRIFDFDWSADAGQLLLARGDISSDVVILTNLR